ncbi:MAG: S8 family serine peptidase [Candidatus Woesearchaeota archaeon]
MNYKKYLNKDITLVRLIFTIIFFVIILLVSLISICPFISAQNTQQISDKNKIFLASRYINTEKKTIENDYTSISQFNNKHILIQFDHALNEQEKLELEKNGVKLLSYIPNNAWYVKIENPNIESLSTISFISNILPNDKISQNIIQQKTKNNELTVVAYFFEDILEENIQKIVNEYSINKNSFKVTDIIYDNVWQLKISSDKIFEFASIDSVQWIDTPEPEKITNVDTVRAVIHANEVQMEPYNLHANRYTVAIWDQGTVANHIDFGSRITRPDGGSMQAHPTSVCGIMTGDGTNSENRGGTPFQWRGIATMPNIVSYDWYGNLTNEINQAINVYEAKVSHNSWGINACILPCNNFGSYTSTSVTVDSVTRGIFGNKMSFVGSAGNDGDCNLCQSYLPNFPFGTIVGPIATAKNSLSVGGTYVDTDTVWDGSSRGPTKDGRIKPDITAPSCKTYGGIKSTSNNMNDYIILDCGTSYAAPSVSGSVILIYEKYNEFYNQDPLPSTVRAIVYHTAEDLGNTGPDYIYGYGRINIQRAIDLIIADDGINNIIRENEINSGEQDIYLLNVPDNKTELKVTLVWDDKQASPQTNITLVNNLDLELESPSGQIFRPWILDPENPNLPATTGIDNRNNVEQILINNPQPGQWIIRINSAAIQYSPQTYSLLADFSGNGEPTLNPIGNQIIYENDTLLIHIQATDPNGQQLAYFTNAHDVLPSNFSFDQETGLFQWTPTYNDAGIYYVTFNVTDGQFWDTETVQINVINVNRAPIINPINDIVINETFNVTIIVNATDPDNDNLIYSINDSRFIVNNNLFIWPTNFTSSGNYSFEITVSDGEYSEITRFNVMVLDYFIPGDANCNGVVNGMDVTYMINYFKGNQPAPYCGLLSIDTNGDCNTNGIDVTYLVRYFKGGGSPPRRGNCG